MKRLLLILVGFLAVWNCYGKAIPSSTSRRLFSSRTLRKGSTVVKPVQSPESVNNILSNDVLDEKSDSQNDIANDSSEDYDEEEDEDVETFGDEDHLNSFQPSAPQLRGNEKEGGLGGNGSDDDGSDNNGVDDVEDTDFEDLGVDEREHHRKTRLRADQQQQLMDIWQEYIIPAHALSESELQLISNPLSEETALALSLRPNGTDRGSFYTQLFAQLFDPLIKSNNRAQWLDQDFALHLKGATVLSLYSNLAKQFAGRLVDRFRRGIRLITNTQERRIPDNTGLAFVHQTIAKALAHSVNSDTIFVNARLMNRIRHRIGESVSKASALRGLLRVAANNERPLIVVFNDDMKWLLNNEAASDVLLQECKSPTANLFFLAIEPSLEAVKDTPVANHAPATPQLSNPFPSFSGFLGPPPASGAMSPQQQQGEGGTPVNFPPGMLPPGMVVTSRAFQVIMHPNGSTTMVQLPPNHPMNNMPPTLPPPDVLRRMFEQQRMQQQQQEQGQDGTNNSNNQTLPEEVEESLKEFMEDENNKAAIKNLMDNAANAFAQFMQRGNKSPEGGFDPQQQQQQIQPQQQQQQTQFSMAPKQAPVLETIDDEATNEESEVSKKKKQKDKEKKRGSSMPFFRSSSSSKQTSKAPSSSSSSTSSKAGKLAERDPEDIDESSISTSGKMLLQWLEDLTLIPSRDQSLRQLWDRIQEEEISQKALRQNRRLLNAQLRQAKVHLPVDQLTALDDLLSRVPLNKEQIREAVLFTVRLQAGALNLALSHVDADIQHQDGEEAAKPLAVWAMDHALTQTVARLPSVSKSSASLRPRSATGSLLNGLTREDLNAMNLDKHERQLLSNVVIPSEIGVTYNMIGGLVEAKELLRQSVTYPLKYPRLYNEGVAAEAVKGVLLFGPPGTGKTLLAKAVATEGGAAFLAVDASTIENKWLGESEKNARAVFTLARKLAPCVIYLDEVDSVLASREHGDDSSHGTLTSVKTTLMQEWDGLRTTKEDRVVVIASTNRPFDLDEAVLRRLPRRIMVDLPDLHTRQEILAVTLTHNRLAPDVNLTTLAEQLDGFTGSDVKEVCREAVVRVAHERAHRLETGSHHYIENIKQMPQSTQKQNEEDATNNQEHESIDWSAPLRPVTMNDFLEVLKKLKASVDDAGREMQKVVEWNEKYGEVKRKTKRRPAQLSMYI